MPNVFRTVRYNLIIAKINKRVTASENEKEMEDSNKSAERRVLREADRGEKWVSNNWEQFQYIFMPLVGHLTSL